MLNHWKKLGWLSVMSVALFALAGCTRASAEASTEDQVHPVTVQAQADQQPSADAEADNGPGCAESLARLHAAGLAAPHRSRPPAPRGYSPGGGAGAAIGAVACVRRQVPRVTSRRCRALDSRFGCVQRPWASPRGAGVRRRTCPPVQPPQRAAV